METATQAERAVLELIQTFPKEPNELQIKNAMMSAAFLVFRLLHDINTIARNSENA